MFWKLSSIYSLFFHQDNHNWAVYFHCLLTTPLIPVIWVQNLGIFLYFLPLPYHPHRTHYQDLCDTNSPLRMPLKVPILSKVTPSSLGLIHSLLACVIPSLMFFSSLASTASHSFLSQNGRPSLRWPWWCPFPMFPPLWRSLPRMWTGPVMCL